MFVQSDWKALRSLIHKIPAQMGKQISHTIFGYSLQAHGFKRARSIPLNGVIKAHRYTHIHPFYILGTQIPVFTAYPSVATIVLSTADTTVVFLTSKRETPAKNRLLAKVMPALACQGHEYHATNCTKSR